MNDNKTAKVALITGSGRKRVGYVIAKHLAIQGWQVALHYHRSEESARENANELNNLGAASDCFQADVTDEHSVATLVQQVVDRFGSLDLVVTTASIWTKISLENLTAEHVLGSFRVNTLGTFWCCKFAGMRMVEQPQGGCIVTIGDSLIRHPYVDHAAYFVAKGTIPTLTRTFAVELASRNPRVRVNCIEPGPVMFPDDLSAQEEQLAIDSTLAKTADQPEAVAMAVRFLAENPMITGACLPVDAGRNVGLEDLRRRMVFKQD